MPGTRRGRVRSLITAVLVLPGTALVYVPALLLWASLDAPLAAAVQPPDNWEFWIALLLAAASLPLMGGTTRLFLDVGDGTPAPWDPPRRLVVRGPYRYVRNPMISGVLIMLGAEALYFGSWWVAGWMGVFFLGNAFYFPRVEEKGLHARFGDAYGIYKANVPRWLPRITPWTPNDDGA